MATKNTVPELARTVKDRLEKEGVVVRWDDAHTTGSVYLDLDLGVLGSVRVSDHKGKANGYRFEIGPHIKDAHTVDKTLSGQVYSVMKFPDTKIEDLIESVLIHRMRIKAKVGVVAYKESVTYVSK